MKKNLLGGILFALAFAAAYGAGRAVVWFCYRFTWCEVRHAIYSALSLAFCFYLVLCIRSVGRYFDRKK